MTGTPVRVCFLIDELAPAGTETQLLALIRRLDRRRVQPHLCLLRGDKEQSRSLEPDCCPVLRLGVGSLRSPATLPRLWRLGRYLRRQRIDVLQVYFPDSTYAGVPVGWLAGVPVVRTRNNLGHWLTPLHRGLGRLLNRLTAATVANCEAARLALLEAEHPRPNSVIVLENGVDVERFEGIPALDERPEPLARVAALANLRHVKGLDVLIEAAARLVRNHTGVTFRVGGEGPECGALQRQVANLGLVGRFHLCGSVADVPGFLAETDVAVLPSRAEGMSNAVLEYMAAGRAIVATDVGGNSRLLEHGVHGLLVPPDDPAALAAAVGTLLSDRGLACRLGAAARRRAREQFSRAAMVRRFEDFFEDIARRNSRRSA
jgi:glycosyltransferase involved in cell wall biosynthesis